MQKVYGAFGNDADKMQAAKEEKTLRARQEGCSHDFVEAYQNDTLLICRKCGKEGDYYVY